MNTLVKSAPQVISNNVEQEMTPSYAEICELIRKEARPTRNIPWCQQYINIGVFFDGTDNNRIRDEPLKSHTNIVKLYNAHKSVDGYGWLKEPGHYRIYVPGLGTRFPENREWRESMEGKAFGKGGQARILYALLEVYNAVHRVFNENRPMFNLKDIAAKLQQYTQDIDTGDPLRDAHAPRPDRRSWFSALSKELDTALREARTKRPLPQIPLISLSVFGFSRGATLARAFCYWFNDLLVKDKTFAGMPTRIEFLGLFECVASVGMSQSAAETTPAFWADGHWDWARETLQPLPDCVRQTVHYVAAHEQRRNFPVTRVTGNNVTEVVYPGVHADLGGGYAPGDHGRGIEKDKGLVSMLLSQVALAHMHRAATKAGVPLAAYCIMASDQKEDHAIHSKLVYAWNDYMAASSFNGDYHSIIRQHMTLYYAYRRQRLGSMEHSVGYYRATPQEQHNIKSYNDLLRGDVAILKARAQLAKDEATGRDQFGQFVRGRPSLLFGTKNHDGVNAWQQRLAKNGTPPGADELWVLEQMSKPWLAQNTPFLTLLENYIHDSLANFYLAGFTTLQDKAEELLRIGTIYDQTGKGPSTPYRSRVWKNYLALANTDQKWFDMLKSRIDTLNAADNLSGYHPAKTNAENDALVPYYRADKIKAQQNAQQQTVFSPEEQAELAQFFPLQTDADVAELRSVLIVTQTNTRREGSGYLRPRHVFE